MIKGHTPEGVAQPVINGGSGRLLGAHHESIWNDVMGVIWHCLVLKFQNA